MASSKQRAAFAKMLSGKKGKVVAPTKGKTIPTAKAKGKGTPTIGNAINMMPNMPPMGKPSANPKVKGKKTALKIDIMLAKAMPGIGMPPKKVVKKASSFPKGTTKALTAGTAYAVGKTRTKKVAKKKVGKK